MEYIKINVTDINKFIFNIITIEKQARCPHNTNCKFIYAVKENI